jgi:hypothetical protein
MSSSEETRSAPGKRAFLSALRVYTERPALVMVALGFSAVRPAVLGSGLAANAGVLAAENFRERQRNRST